MGGSPSLCCTYEVRRFELAQPSFRELMGGGDNIDPTGSEFSGAVQPWDLADPFVRLVSRRQAPPLV